MVINGQNLCIGCMRPLKDDFVCSSCHFEQKKYRPIPRCLLPGTEVAERYVLGRVLGEGNFEITYIGWDKVLSKRVAVKEYYPTIMSAVMCSVELTERFMFMRAG